MANLTPGEVEEWLLGLKSLLSGEAVRELANEVKRSKMDGAAFGELVANRTTPASLRDVIRPSHMATLRRCWNSERPQPKAEPPKAERRDENRINGDRHRQAPQSEASRAPLSEASKDLFSEAPCSEAPLAPRGRDSEAAKADGSSLAEVRARQQPLQAGQQRSNFAPPPRGSQATSVATAPVSVVAAPAAALFAAAPDSDDGSPGLRPPTDPFADETRSPPPVPPIRMVQERKQGECHDKAARPAQVPRLDLSTLHAKEGNSGQVDKLGTQLWMKPCKQPWTDTGPQYPVPNKESLGTEPARPDSAPQGFACATQEDQQRIAEFYGYRDEGFVATMHGLKTDCIRPRLYLGTMADAAYWPLLQSLCITHILNVAIEAQRATPPYDSQGIQYMLLPWQDSTEQAHSLCRQRFRQLREATRYINKSLNTSFQVEGQEKKASVLVHCVQGMNRSSTIVCAYLMEYEGVSLDRALAEVRGKHRGCLSSRHWQDFLHKFDAELLRGI